MAPRGLPLHIAIPTYKTSKELLIGNQRIYTNRPAPGAVIQVLVCRMNLLFPLDNPPTVYIFVPIADISGKSANQMIIDHIFRYGVE